jgi:subtilisin family serine protease
VISNRIGKRSLRFLLILIALRLADLPLAGAARRIEPAAGERAGCIVAKTTTSPVVSEDGFSLSFTGGASIKITDEMHVLIPAARFWPCTKDPGNTLFYARLNGKDRSTASEFIAQLSAQSQNAEYYTLEPRPRLASPPLPVTPDFGRRQAYLEADGVNARRAWNLGDMQSPKIEVRGKGVQIFDIEFGWIPPTESAAGHEDLPGPKHGEVSWQSKDFDEQQHGTAVAGVLAAIDNKSGISGVASGSTLKFQPIEPSAENSSGGCLTEAICNAANAAKAGDVLLIEVQMPPPPQATFPPLNCTCNLPQCGSVPAEAWPEVREAIEIVKQVKKVVVVEAAGNGSVDLDALKDEKGAPLFSADVSHGILVAAAKPYGGQPMCYTNFGTAVDLESWGEKVTTTGFGNLFHASGAPGRYYTSSFGGTSSAAAIVGGVVADVESAAKSLCNNKALTTDQMLGLLRRTGITETCNKYIGVRPDLYQAVKSLKDVGCPGGSAPAP